jgi:hypothetical protein
VNGDNHTSNVAVQNADYDRNKMTLPIVDIPLEDEGNEYTFSMTLLNNQAYWIGDIGATRHTSGCPLSSLARVTPETSTSTMADGHSLTITQTGDYLATCYDKNGKTIIPRVTFADVGHIPGGYSLFAIPKLLANGWSLRVNNEIGLQLTQDEATLKFDIRVKTPKGYVWAMYAPSRHEGETVLAKAISPRRNCREEREPVEG